MPVPFLGFDHIDVRVSSLSAVEGFYDRLMPALGLTTKTYSHVASDGTWYAASDERPYNTVEYHEAAAGRILHFIGFIEDARLQPMQTRIAFRVASKADVLEWETRLHEIGARDIELDEEFDDYPAVFFTDPSGTKLELCARRPRA